MEKITLHDAIECVDRVAQDATSVAVLWAFDKRRVFVGRSDFNGEHFIECLKVLVAKIDRDSPGKGRRIEFNSGGTKSKPTTPKPNIKPAGQKPVKHVSKRIVTYNDRVVGPS